MSNSTGDEKTLEPFCKLLHLALNLILFITSVIQLLGFFMHEVCWFFVRKRLPWCKISLDFFEFYQEKSAKVDFGDFRFLAQKALSRNMQAVLKILEILKPFLCDVCESLSSCVRTVFYLPESCTKERALDVSETSRKKGEAEEGPKRVHTLCSELLWLLV